MWMLLLPLVPIGLLLTPGLIGLMDMFGLPGTGLVNLAFGIAILLLVLVSMLNANFHFKEHVLRLAPWAITVLTICGLIRIVRG